MSLGIYIHIPFCRAKCHYCDFNSYAGLWNRQDDYLDALKREIQSFSETVFCEANTVYLGGGTPTALPPITLVQLLDTVRARFSLADDCEVTVECNPATIDEAGLRMLREAGVNRLSIGMQASQDTILRKLGRIHTFKQFDKCFRAARRAGFLNLSLDLMFGLPDQTMEMWRETLEKALIFEPSHISCYSLKVEEGTPFASMDLNLPDDDENRDMYDLCVERLEEAGYLRYEISNFAHPGGESRHNCKYWRCQDYAAFGAGAYSYMNGVRRVNMRSVDDYIQAIKSKENAVEEEEKLTLQEQMSEFFFLGLRMEQGVDLQQFYVRFGVEAGEVFGSVIEKNLRRHSLIQTGSRLYIPPELLYVSNSVLVDFV